jgi:hypothetical protein
MLWHFAHIRISPISDASLTFSLVPQVRQEMVNGCIIFSVAVDFFA